MKIIFTNGCFDILHIGHIRYLQKAKNLGDYLIVGVNSDASFKRHKKRDPINPENWRAEALMALKSVDEVRIFREDTPYDLIEAVRPDILVKGGDYKLEDIVGRELVKETLTLESDINIHTSDILAKLKYII